MNRTPIKSGDKVVLYRARPVYVGTEVRTVTHVTTTTPIKTLIFENQRYGDYADFINIEDLKRENKWNPEIK